MSQNKTKAPVVPRPLLVPFILVTILFPLWGFANDITNPMVAAFKNILLISNFESSLVQAAFYGGYALMAIPAAIFIKRFSYKKGILIGLALYALGCLLFIPSGISLTFAPFLAAYLIMTCGLSFLETTANPYVLSMGDPSTATRRLNLAQAFNPMGSIMGMFVASMFILINLDGTSEDGRRAMFKASEGTPVYAQMVAEQEETVTELLEVTAEPDWTSKKKWLKKASELSESLHQDLALLADPKAEQAREIEERIAAQPTQDKFAAAINAVAVVLQIREPVTKTEAEELRDELFHGGEGLQMAKMLGTEAELLAGDPDFAEAKVLLAKQVATAGELNEHFAGLYEAKGGAPANGADTVENVKQLGNALGEVKAELAQVSKDQLAPYFATLGERFKGIQKSDLGIVVWPYALMGGFLILVLALFALKLPPGSEHEGDNKLHLGATFKRLVKNERYIEGVVAQTAYVGAQIMCWTFIIQYAELELGLAKSTAQNCNILAMIIFVSSRFICTFLLHYIKPGMLLGLLATGGVLFTRARSSFQGYTGLYCLIGVSACMSLMFPTIYGIALEGLGDDAKLGSAGLILAIGGGCLMPPMQAAIIDLPPIDLGFMELASVRASFFLPLLCFVVIALYGLRTFKGPQRQGSGGLRIAPMIRQNPRRRVFPPLPLMCQPNPRQDRPRVFPGCPTSPAVCPPRCSAVP
jgi:fucose permease